MLRGGATPLRVLRVSDESCIEIEWIGRCRWLDLFTGLVSLIEASRSIVEHTANCVMQ